MARPALKDRLFTALCLVGAVVVLVGGFARGNPRVAVVGAGFFLGYAVLQSVTRRLTPAARLVSGQETDLAERMAQFRATRLAGQAALLVAAVGLALELGVEWAPGLWVAGTALLVVAVFVGGLVWFSPRTAPARRSDQTPRAPRAPGAPRR
jgi:drug/metabolite transporter (DMT)-like permease